VSKIFINYRRDDRAPIALNIAQYLERIFGADSIFLDIDRLRAGEQFPLVLEKRLSECRVMLAIIGPNWFNASDESGRRRLEQPDDWVRLEIARALARNVRVIPVLVDGATLPKKSLLPEDIRALVDRQSFTLTNPAAFRHEVAGLVRDIGGMTRRAKTFWRTAGILAAASVAVAFIVYRYPDLARSTFLASQSGQATDKGPKCSATAVSDNGGYGYATGSASLKAAEAEAMRHCTSMGDNTGCHIVTSDCP
jgi:hypothetical protein